jgi:hypothetical protein
MNEEPETRLEPALSGAGGTETRQPGKPGFAERARRHREALRGRVHSDSTELIREDRARDYDNAWS